MIEPASSKDEATFELAGSIIHGAMRGAFSKLKTILRRIGARTREALQEAIIEALPRITAQDALGWFLYCGYPAPSTGNTAQSLSTTL